MTERPTYESVFKRNQSKVVRPLALSSRATQPEQPHKFMIIANAIFYNGTQPDKVYLGENLVWEKTVTPPTPTYGSKTFAGKFIDNSTDSNWKFWPNGKTSSPVDIRNYVNPTTKEFAYDYEDTLTSCDYMLNGNNTNNGKWERIDHIPDTSEVTSMIMMFANNNDLVSANISDLNTSKVTKMSSMFVGAGKLPELNLSGWDVSNVTDASMMFYNCSKLATLNLSGWNLSNCTTLSSTFYGCAALTNIQGPMSGIKVNINLYNSPLLTADSIMVIINALVDVGAKRTIQLAKTAYNQLTTEQIAVATSKGWSFTVL